MATIRGDLNRETGYQFFLMLIIRKGKCVI